nr:hypothetical protein [Tanacetum cinerariifolium]
MLDSEHSSVTYTSVPSLVKDYSYIWSPEVDGPPSLDYVPGPEEPEQAPLSPNYDDVFLAEEQPLPIAATPTADSPRYILEFDPKGDLEEDPEEDPVDYPATLQLLLYHLLIMSHPRSPTHIEILESCLPLQKRLRFASPTPSQEVGESSAAGAARQDEPTVARDDPYSLVREELYGFVDRDELVGASEEIAPTTLQGVNKRVADLSTIVEQETTIMYVMMEEAQDDRSELTISELYPSLSPNIV